MKDIPGYEELYAATKDGRIWSYKTQKFLKQGMSGRGYLTVVLCKDGNRKTYVVHRLIALTYIPNPDNFPEVDHIDRDRVNNSIENLRWVTHSENNLNKDWEQICEKMSEAYFNTPTEVREERARKASQARSRAVEMRDKNNHDILIKTYPNGRQAAIQEFGDARKNNHISECANGKRPSAYGYFWTFVNTDTSYENET